MEYIWSLIIYGRRPPSRINSNDPMYMRPSSSIAAAIGLFMVTERGRTLWKFIQGSRVEIRKVVWPTRQETLQTALTVMVFALILGLFFWGLDFFLLWITRLLTGYGE